MEFLAPFVAVLVILQDSIKLLPKNGKLMAFIILAPTLLSSLCFLIFFPRLKSVFLDMFWWGSFMITSSESPDYAAILSGLKEDLTRFLAIYVLFILASSLIVNYSNVATILLSASSYMGRTLSYKDLALLTIRARRRQHKTAWYKSLLVFGYSTVFILFVACPALIISINAMADAFTSAILVGIAACIGYLYLSTVWALGLVISVVEENCYGIEALGRAGGLLEGKKIHAFILNIMFPLPPVVLFAVFWIIRGPRWVLDNDIMFWLFIVIFSCLLRLFYFVAYTVLYFQCKKNHGEEIEFQGRIEDSKIV